MDKLPKHFVKLQERFGPVIEQLEALREAISKAGPIDEKTGQSDSIGRGGCSAVGGCGSQPRPVGLIKRVLRRMRFVTPWFC